MKNRLFLIKEIYCLEKIKQAINDYKNLAVIELKEDENYYNGYLSNKKLDIDEEYIQKEIENAGKRVQCLELIPEHMTGKLVKES